MELDRLRKELNPRQKALREALQKPERHEDAIPLFLDQHGILHSAKVAPEAPWSYEDLLLDKLTDTQYRIIPDGQEHSLIWILWHLSRIEDITMNLLVSGKDQLFTQEDWQAKMKAPIKHTGNGTGLETANALDAAVDIDALREYRHAVGRATRRIVKQLTPADFTRKPTPENLQRIKNEGAVLDIGYGVIDYWGKQTVAGLLLMPPTRHTIIHLNEARRIINKLS